METWRPVDGYEGSYEVSDQGNVRSVARRVVIEEGKTRIVNERILKTPIVHGYCTVNLSRNGARTKRYVHSLVLEAFRGPCPDGMQCLHGDGNQLNNNVGNLRWGTSLENHADRKAHGTVKRGSGHGRAKLSEGDVAQIRRDLAASCAKAEIARRYGVGESTIRKIEIGQNWRQAA